MEQWEGGLLSLYFVHITAEYIPLDDDGIITYMPRQGSFLTVKYITMESYIITRKKTRLGFARFQVCSIQDYKALCQFFYFMIWKIL